MGFHKRSAAGFVTLSEIKEFASFSGAAQRYIRRSLDIAFDRKDAIALWSRDNAEAQSIAEQKDIYHRLQEIRECLPESSMAEEAEFFMAPLVTVSAFDLGQGALDNFSSYRFLYERLICAEARPWLPAAFCSAASLPQLKPQMRKNLLQSISEAAATAQGWSRRQPSFYPEWVEKIDTGLSAH